MIADAPTTSPFGDFCLGMYVLVDELWTRVGAWYRRPGRRSSSAGCW